MHPPLCSLLVIEHLLATLRAQGWGPEAAVEAYQAFCSFLLGFLLEVSSQGESVVPGAGLDEGGPDDPHAGEGSDREVDVTDYPTVTELRPLLESSDITAEFRAGLDALFVRLRDLAPHA